jgi:hypothetical protein
LLEEEVEEYQMVVVEVLEVTELLVLVLPLYKVVLLPLVEQLQ